MQKIMVSSKEQLSADFETRPLQEYPFSPKTKIVSSVGLKPSIAKIPQEKTSMSGRNLRRTDSAIIERAMFAVQTKQTLFSSNSRNIK